MSKLPAIGAVIAVLVLVPLVAFGYLSIRMGCEGGIDGHTYLMSAEKKAWCTRWFGIVYETPAPIEESDVQEEGEEPEESPGVEPGTYVVYQARSIIDKGSKDWANDDTSRTVLIAYDVERGTTNAFGFTDRLGTDGSVVSSIYGDGVLAHRWGPEVGDAVIALDGTTVEETPEDWARLQSRDGSVVATWENNEYEPVAWMTVTRDGEEVSKTRIDNETMGVRGPGGVIPAYVSDDGKYVYLWKGPWEGLGTIAVWRYDIDAGTMHLVNAVADHDLYEVRINPALNQLIGVHATPIEDKNWMGGMAPGSPSSIYLIDLVKDSATLLRESDTFYLNRVHLSSDGTLYSYHVEDADAVWIDAVEYDGTDSDYHVSGNVLAWEGALMVIDREGELIIYDPTAEKEVVSIDRTTGNYWDPDFRRVEFIGVITISEE